MRVLTVTLNPCVDRTFWVDAFDEPPQRRERMSGGKGINVARVLRALGDDCLALAPVGGASGEAFARLAREEGVPLREVRVAGETRTVDTYVRLADYEQRVTFGPGPELTAEETARLTAAVYEALPDCAVLAICGSAGCERAARCVPEWIEEARRRGIRTLLDSSGSALELGVEARPDVLKPNQKELMQILGRAVALGEEADAAQALVARGVSRVLVSLGERGVVQATETSCEFCPAPAVRAVNPVGSGDCFVAGWLHGQMAGYSDRFCLALGCAAGAANAAQWPAAKITRQDVEAILGYHV